MTQISEATFIPTPVGNVKGGKRIPVSSAAKTELDRPSLTREYLAYNGKSVEGIIEKDHLVKRARESLHRKEFEAWVREDLKLKPNGVKLFLGIANHAILSDPKNWRRLPVDYRSLYELSQIDDDKLRDLIEQGKVHHDLTRGKATQLKLDSWGDVESADNSFSEQPEPNLPLQYIPESLKVLRHITRKFVSDKAWKPYDSQNPRPAELPSKEEIETAFAWVEMKREQMRGAR